MTERSNHPEGVLSLQNIAMPADTNWSGDVLEAGLYLRWISQERFMLSV